MGIHHTVLSAFVFGRSLSAEENKSMKRKKEERKRKKNKKKNTEIKKKGNEQEGSKGEEVALK